MRSPAQVFMVVGVLLILIVILSPIVSIVFVSLTAQDSLLQYLSTPAVLRYAVNTLVLVGGVACVALVIGVGTAWLVSSYEFPFRRILELALFFPLAIPAYVGAYALVDFFEFAGPFQTALRAAFGWNLATDYFFPQIRTQGGAILVLSLSLYPYVYLLTRSAMREKSVAALEVASTLGAGRWSRFVRVTLPMVRPGIVSGLVIVMMETVADFGVVDYFAVQTLTTAIYSTWLVRYDVGGAAQISLVILVIVTVIVGMERVGRGRAAYHQSALRPSASGRHAIVGAPGLLIAGMCALPVLFGFALPVGVMLGHALENREHWLDRNLVQALINTLYLCTAAAIATVAAANLLVFVVRGARSWLGNTVLSLTMIGYATPGAILGLGILLPLSKLDHAVADAWQYLTGEDPGLLMTGSAFAVGMAYCIRFFALAQGAADSAMGRVSPNIVSAARSLGRTAAGTLVSVKMPIMRGSMIVAALLVFVDSVKELPATLLLRPFNFNTLATRVYERASLEAIGEAAPAALLVTLVGCMGVAVIARTRNRLVDSR